MSKLTQEHILQIVRNKRKAKGLTQWQVAKELNISQTSYNAIETGQTELRINLLNELMELLEIEPEELLPTKPTTTAPTEEPTVTDLVFINPQDINQSLIDVNQRYGNIEKELYQLRQENSEIKTLLQKLFDKFL